MRIRHSAQKNPLVWTRISEIMTCEELNIFFANLAYMADIKQDHSKLNKSYKESLSFGKIIAMQYFFGLFATHYFTFKPLISSFYYFVIFALHLLLQIFINVIAFANGFVE